MFLRLTPASAECRLDMGGHPVSYDEFNEMEIMKLSQTNESSEHLEFIMSIYGISKSNWHCCGAKTFRRIQTRRAYKCVNCQKQFYPTANTIFEKTTTPLKDWVYAMALISVNAEITARDIQKRIRVTYKTAWRIKNLICKSDFYSNLSNHKQRLLELI